jgi:hypothetical protein
MVPSAFGGAGTEMPIRNSRRVRTAAIALCGIAFVFGAGACGSTPSEPSPHSASQTSLSNAPPVIHAIALSKARAEADQPLQATAFVSDADTPLDQLVYAWSAAPAAGTFLGNGPQVSWQPPHVPQTPDMYTLTLNVTETFTQGGRTRQNKVSSTVKVHYNDSSAEITTLSLQFLKDFTTYSVSPAECVRNFSDSCVGKAEELGDIAYNRLNFHILGGDYHVQNITYNADRTFANVTAPCTFYDIPRGGVRERVDGTCLLTATYENWSWWLCKSNFLPAGSAPRTVMGRALMRTESERPEGP